ncbi:MAG: aspartate carbamoyltransferase [Leptospiraceae bacterium]|nr:aspartate carbamoyltransferase [Leptospiraceae bacterium]MDW8307608.1 aspartate carbamoyltransferase [Leptospiraceae bacterium]
MALKSVLSAAQFTREDLDRILELSRQIELELQKRKTIPRLGDYVLATLFFEPSTRTRLSFEAAMHRLGGKVISSVGVQFSSLAKGETLYDTLKMVEAYSDICAIRHPVEGASQVAAANIKIPVINAGDGAGEHPTQALLDLYTIEKHCQISRNRLKIAFIGDIKYGRTIHSLIQLLWHYDCELVFISPPELRLGERYIRLLQENKVIYTETENIEALLQCDVAYVTRIQEERFADHREYERFKDRYIVNRSLVERAERKLIVMHPLPRLSEVSTDLDDHPAGVYFDQAQNGLYVRMALLLELLGVKL